MKKLLCLFLTVLFVLPTGIYANEEEPPKPIKVQLNGSYLELDVQPTIIDDRLMIPFRSIAEKIGVSVDYNKDSRQVIAKKGKDTITFTINKKSVEVSGKNGAKTIDMEVAPVIYKDRTLVPLRFFAESFDIEVGWDYSENTAILVDYSYFVNQIKEKDSNFYKAISLEKVISNAHYSTTFNEDIVAKSEVFGVNIHAGSNVDADIKQDGKKISADVNILNNGLYNLATFYMQTQRYGGNESDEVITPDFDKPMNIKFMLNDETLFVKSDFILGMILNSYNYSFLDKDYREKLKSNWIKLSNDNAIYGNSGLENLDLENLDVDTRLELAVKQLLQIGYEYKDSTNYFENINKKVTAFTELLSNDNLVLNYNDDGSAHITYKIDEKTIYNAIMKIVNSIDDEDEKEEATKNVNQYLKVLHFNLAYDANIKDGIVLDAAVDATAKLDNIPNQYNMQIGTIEAKLNAKSVSSDIGKVTIAESDFPSENVISQEQLDQEALKARVKHYTDLGYTVDENGNITDYDDYCEFLKEK
ncbi:MAG: copper amine oxidase N-terminal domain-containing protein [Bacillota bacterium]|nr:copper amine oxidase N-terminal domain-containing protein [Bacillota bacterium]